MNTTPDELVTNIIPINDLCEILAKAQSPIEDVDSLILDIVYNPRDNENLWRQYSPEDASRMFDQNNVQNVPERLYDLEINQSTILYQIVNGTQVQFIFTRLNENNIYTLREFCTRQSQYLSYSSYAPIEIIDMDFQSIKRCPVIQMDIPDEYD